MVNEISTKCEIKFNKLETWSLLCSSSRWCFVAGTKLQIVAVAAVVAVAAADTAAWSRPAVASSGLWRRVVGETVEGSLRIECQGWS